MVVCNERSVVEADDLGLVRGTGNGVEEVAGCGQAKGGGGDRGHASNRREVRAYMPLDSPSAREFEVPTFFLVFVFIIHA